MRFLSIDSSLCNTGIARGVITPNGDILIDLIDLRETEKAPKKMRIRASSDTVERCKKTYNFLKEHIDEYRPHVIFIETPSGSQNASGMKSYGATCQLIATLNPDPIQVTPEETKVGSVGDKKASKETIINWAYKRYPELQWFRHAGKLQAKNEHMADAIAIAYAGMHLPDFVRLRQMIP